jgi:hypothetical protein
VQQQIQIEGGHFITMSKEDTMSSCYRSFTNADEARRFAYDLLRWGDESLCPDDLAAEIEAALEEAVQLEQGEDLPKEIH